VTRMLLVKNRGKEYLLLGVDSSSSVALLDVSKPNQGKWMTLTSPTSIRIKSIRGEARHPLVCF